MIYDLLSALNTDIDEDKCVAVMVNVVFLITNYSCNNIKMWVIIPICKPEEAYLRDIISNINYSAIRENLILYF